MLERPAGFGTVDLLLVGGADALASSLDGVIDVGNCDGGEQPDDGYHDHDFNQGESLPRFHGKPFVLMVDERAGDRPHADWRLNHTPPKKFRFRRSSGAANSEARNPQSERNPKSESRSGRLLKRTWFDWTAIPE